MAGTFSSNTRQRSIDLSRSNTEISPVSSSLLVQNSCDCPVGGASTVVDVRKRSQRNHNGTVSNCLGPYRRYTTVCAAGDFLGIRHPVVMPASALPLCARHGLVRARPLPRFVMSPLSSPLVPSSVTCQESGFAIVKGTADTP